MGFKETDYEKLTNVVLNSTFQITFRNNVMFWE